MANCINCLYWLDRLDYGICCNSKSPNYQNTVGSDCSCELWKSELEYVREFIYGVDKECDK